MISAFRLLAFSFLGVAGLFVQVKAQEKALTEMTIVSSSFPPYCIANENDTPEGIYVSVLEELLKPLSAVPKFHIVPFKRGLALLESGQADAMIGLIRTPEREKYIHFVEPPYLANSCQAFYVARGRGNDIKTYQDLSKLQSIGVVSGYKNFSQFDEDSTLKKDESLNSFIGLKKLVHGRIDAMLLHEDIGDYLVAVNNFRGKVEKSQFKHYEHVPIYICLSKHSPWLAREKGLSARINLMVRSGRMDVISQDYLKRLLATKRP